MNKKELINLLYYFKKNELINKDHISFILMFFRKELTTKELLSFREVESINTDFEILSKIKSLIKLNKAIKDSDCDLKEQLEILSYYKRKLSLSVATFNRLRIIITKNLSYYDVNLIVRCLNGKGKD